MDVFLLTMENLSSTWMGYPYNLKKTTQFHSHAGFMRHVILVNSISNFSMESSDLNGGADEIEITMEIDQFPQEVRIRVVSLGPVGIFLQNSWLEGWITISVLGRWCLYGFLKGSYVDWRSRIASNVRGVFSIHPNRAFVLVDSCKQRYAMEVTPGVELGRLVCEESTIDWHKITGIDLQKYKTHLIEVRSTRKNSCYQISSFINVEDDSIPFQKYEYGLSQFNGPNIFLSDRNWFDSITNISFWSNLNFF